MNPAKLSFNLNLIDLSISGYWFCQEERKITEREEDHLGMSRCKMCGSNRIRWNPPVFEQPPLSCPMAETYRQKLDSACDRCQTALREAVNCPSEENFAELTRAIAMAHGALSDLSELETKLRHESSRQAA